MSLLTTENTKPSQLDLTYELYGSKWQSKNMELSACRFVVLCQRNSDKWLNMFIQDELDQLCKKHNIGSISPNDFVDSTDFEIKSGRYILKDSFINEFASKAVHLMELVKPSQVSFHNFLYHETYSLSGYLVQHLLIMSQNQEMWLKDFTFEDYLALAKDITEYPSKNRSFEKLVEMGYLLEKDGVYNLCRSFVLSLKISTD